MKCVFLCLLGIFGFTLSDYTFITKYIDVPLDHFSFASNVTFKLKYLYNDTHWKENGPVFFYTGNEGQIEVFAQNTGFVWEIAPEFGALIVFAEHRYYGQSLPFGNQSFSSLDKLGYLTSSQALSDYVFLIDYLKKTPLDQNKKQTAEYSPVIAFGGSYGGMLASWMRMKYPASIQGAIAASAPIFQFSTLTPCDIYNRIVTGDFGVSSSSGRDCTIPIKNSWKEIRKIASTSDGKQWLSVEFKTCKPIKDDEDIKNFIDFLTDVYGSLAMVNYPYPSNFLAPLPANPVKAVCAQLNDPSLTGKPLLHAINKAISIYTNYTGAAKCLDTEPSDSGGISLEGWDFQACTEMVMPMCSTGNDMFETEPWNFTKYSDECYAKWGVRVKRDDYAILEYGGKSLKEYSNIVFSNGLLDPWAGGGVLYTVSETVVAVLIPEGAHHLDLRESNPSDPASVVQAREFEKTHIRKWINEYHARGASTASASTGKSVVLV